MQAPERLRSWSSSCVAKNKPSHNCDFANQIRTLSRLVMQYEFEFQYNATDWKTLQRHQNGQAINYGRFLWISMVLCFAWQAYTVMQIGPLVGTSLLVVGLFLLVKVWIQSRRINVKTPELESRFRFYDDWMSKITNGSESQHNYPDLAEFRANSEYFYIGRSNHGGILPKRCMPVSEQADFAKSIQQKIESGTKETVPLYNSMFTDPARPRFTYTWMEEDVDQLYREVLFSLNDPERKPVLNLEAARRNITLAALTIILIVFCIVFPLILPITCFMISLCILAWLTRRQIRKAQREAKSYLTGNETSFFIEDAFLWIGDSDGVQKISLEKAVRFLGGKHFVGVQTPSNLIYLVPHRAIGDPQSAEAFLRSATIGFGDNVAQKETGNPYQAPG